MPERPTFRKGGALFLIKRGFSAYSFIPAHGVVGAGVAGAGVAGAGVAGAGVAGAGVAGAGVVGAVLVAGGGLAGVLDVLVVLEPVIT